MIMATYSDEKMKLSDYYEQMMDYYPEVIKSIREFQNLIGVQSFEVHEMHEKLEAILNNAFVETAEEDRIILWEKFLKITPMAQKEDEEYEDWLTSRRNAILAKLYHVEKLNTKSIEDIVSIFTGNIAESWIIDSTLYVKVYPSENNKTFSLDGIKAELETRCPAHLKLEVYRPYGTWNAISDTFTTWKDVSEGDRTWNDIMYYVSSDAVFEYIVDENGNSIMDESNNRLFN